MIRFHNVIIERVKVIATELSGLAQRRCTRRLRS